RCVEKDRTRKHFSFLASQLEEYGFSRSPFMKIRLHLYAAHVRAGDLRNASTESAFEHERTGFVTSVDLHSVYATTLLSDRDLNQCSTVLCDDGNLGPATRLAVQPEPYTLLINRQIGAFLTRRYV